MPQPRTAGGTKRKSRIRLDMSIPLEFWNRKIFGIRPAQITVTLSANLTYLIGF